MRVLVTGVPESTGGIGTLIYNLARCNREQGNGALELEFLVPSGSRYIEIFRRDGYTFYECPRLTKPFKYRRTVKRVLRSKHFDYVWINNTSRVDLIVPMLAKKYGARVIQHSHGTDSEERGFKRAVFSALEALWGRKYDSLIDIPVACSESSADYFYKNKALRSRCTVLGNGIFAEKFRFDASRRADRRQELGISDSDVLLGTVGRLTAVKNYGFLIRLMKKLPEEFYCLVLGDGEEREALEALISSEGVAGRVLLTGNRPNVGDYLSAMDVFMMPSFNEGLPFSIVEAQASGLACIASDGISREADITGRVRFLSLECPEEWLDAVLLCRIDGFDRTRGCDLVKEKGFGIEQTYKCFMSLL